MRGLEFQRAAPFLFQWAPVRISGFANLRRQFRHSGAAGRGIVFRNHHVTVRQRGHSRRQFRGGNPLRRYDLPADTRPAGRRRPAVTSGGCNVGRRWTEFEQHASWRRCAATAACRPITCNRRATSSLIASALPGRGTHGGDIDPGRDDRRGPSGAGGDSSAGLRGGMESRSQLDWPHACGFANERK